ncbi:MAG TPA: hypothetical protein VI789_03395 [Dehalococcoidia bacterium]|nr:hypothetical protein [Dehalococcoidia bacterium]
MFQAVWKILEGWLRRPYDHQLMQARLGPVYLSAWQLLEPGALAIGFLKDKRRAWLRVGHLRASLTVLV